MKQLLKLALCLLAIVVAFSCHKKETPKPKSEPILKCDALSEYSFTAEGGSTTFNIKANVLWAIEMSESVDWCTVSPAIGIEGNLSPVVNITVAKNEAYTSRTVTLTLSSLSAEVTSQYTVKITQEAAVVPIITPELSFNPIKIGDDVFDYKIGGTKVYTVTSNTPWKVSCPDTTAIVTKKSDTEVEVTLGISPSLAAERIIPITITSDEDPTVTDVLNVYQERIWTVSGCTIDESTGTSTIVANGSNIHLVTRDPIAFRKVVFHVSNVNLPVNSVMRLLCYNTQPASGCDAQFAWWIGTGYRGGSTTDQKLPYLDIRGAYPGVSPFVKGKYSFEGMTQDMIDNLKTIELSCESKVGDTSLCLFKIAINGTHINTFELGNLWAAGFSGLLTIGFYGEYAVANSSITVNSIEITPW